MASADIKMEVEEGTAKTANGTEEKEKPTQKSAKAGEGPNFRVKVSGLPRFYTATDPLLLSFKELLGQLGLEVKYIRSPKKGNSWLYITFYNQENQEKALKLLKHYVWNDRTLICTLVVADVLKRKQDECDEESAKRIKLDIPLEEQMLMATIPYHAVSYEEQISKKNEEAQCLFKWLTECMENKNYQLIGYIDQEVAKNPKTKLPLTLDEVRKASMVDGYRNKSEFRIAMDGDSKKIVIGYRVDNQVDENIAVASPEALRHVPREMINICKAFEQFVQESPYVPQTRNHDPGVWRLFHIRINKQKQMLVVVLINPTVLDDKKLQELKLQLIYFFSQGAGSKVHGHNVVSLYLHMDPDLKVAGAGDKHKRPPPSGELAHLWGDTHIEEQLLDLKLDIDPNFYFQNNTYGAEELYKAVTEVAEVDKDTTILDLCCGSGGMGMMFARICKQVIGVEVMDVNVEDAKRLAAKNGLTNCEFLQGAVDDLLPQLEEKLKGQKVIPILDPPRVGISAKLILWLRNLNEAQRIVYVCSNHKMPTKNIIDLASIEGENKEFKGTMPFFPKRVVPVDISPHSLRCELVILLERLDMTKVPKPTRWPKKIYHKEKGPVGVLFGQRKKFVPGALYMGNNRKATRKPSRGFRRGFGRDIRSMPLRETMYPLPLREHLYPQGRRPIPPPGMPPRNRPYDFGPSPLAPMIPRPRRDFEYSDFRRDFEDAIDSYAPPPRGPVSRRLAMANAMMEKGMQLAEEAMAEDYTRSGPVPPPFPGTYIGRRGRGAITASPRMGMGVSQMEMDRGMVVPARMTMQMGMNDNMGVRRSSAWNGSMSGRTGMGIAGGMRGRMGLGDRGMVNQRMGMEANYWGGREEMDAGWGERGNGYEDWSQDSQDMWQNNWSRDDFEIVPSRSTILPQRSATLPPRNMRGNRGVGGLVRGRGSRGQPSAGYWRQ